MNTDRFRFRVWDNYEQDYLLDGSLLDGRTGKIAGYFDDYTFSVEQCTGLKDINGTLIYEGDVVNMYIPYEDNHRKCVVQYVIDEGTAQWLAVYLEGKRHHMSLGIAYDITTEYLDGSYCTVIGNIHEYERKENE